VSATPPAWPDAAAGAPRLFAFVDTAYTGFDALVADLAALALPTILYARDLPVRKARLASTPSLCVVAAPIDMDRAARDADLVICHGGHGAIATALLAATPLLLLPRQSEQRLLAGRVQKLGAGLALASTAPDHAAAIRQMLASGSFAAAARGFAARHAGHDIDAAASAIADGCDAVLAGPAR
jgi:UDP:flavonoid glycosyltransferase YjiC (YdhE family)